jgi:hypothetical protein
MSDRVMILADCACGIRAELLADVIGTHDPRGCAVPPRGSQASRQSRGVDARRDGKNADIDRNGRGLTLSFRPSKPIDDDSRHLQRDLRGFGERPFDDLPRHFDDR